MDRNASLDARRGVFQGFAAYTIWGLLPLYLHLLKGVPALQILSHRIVWSLVLLAALAAALRRFGAIRAALTQGRTALLLASSATLIAANWLIYIWAVVNGHVLEASLGYFIIPLFNVALGVAVLGERIRRWQGAAIALAVAGVLVALAGGGAPWIALTLALSFGTYGLIRKVVAIDALGGLTIETLLLAPFAAGVLAWAGAHGTAAWGTSTRVDLLLALTGVVTAAPLLLFAAAARRLRYATMGLLQFISPTLQFLEATALLGEPLRPAHLVTFGLIWAGCALYAWDSVRAARSNQLE